MRIDILIICKYHLLLQWMTMSCYRIALCTGFQYQLVEPEPEPVPHVRDWAGNIHGTEIKF